MNAVSCAVHGPTFRGSAEFAIRIACAGAADSAAAAHEASQYCHSGVKASSGSGNDKAFCDQFRANCRKGDIIIIPNNAPSGRPGFATSRVP
jgi:hypothetical protein